MKSNNWAAALSLSVGVTALAGCGQTPTAPTSKAPAATAQAHAAADFSGGLAAQEGVAAPTSGGTTTAPAGGTSAPMNPAPAPASGGTATAPATGGMAPGGATAPAAGGAVPAGGAVVPPPPTGVLGDTRVGGIGGGLGIYKGWDRGLGVFDFGANALVAFQSNRDTGGGKGSDIFVYDALAQTVLAIPAVNTAADESNPRLSANGTWLVYQTDAGGTDDIYAFDMRTMLIDTLNDLNTQAFDEEQPDVSDDGNLIVYVSDEPGAGLVTDDLFVDRNFKGDADDSTHVVRDVHDLQGKHFDDNAEDARLNEAGRLARLPDNLKKDLKKDFDKGRKDRDGKDINTYDNSGKLIKHHDHFRNSGNALRVYNTHNGSSFIIPIANHGLVDVSWPTISGNGAVIAYGAAHARRDLEDGNKDCKWGRQKSFNHDENRQIYFYSIPDAAQLTPPFINNLDADQGNPDLNLLGDRMVYVSNLNGDYDIFMTDLRSGWTDNMVLANSRKDEQEPRFLGPVGDRVVFQTDRAHDFRMMVYDFPTGLVDTLPVANEVGSDTQLREENPPL